MFATQRLDEGATRCARGGGGCTLLVVVAAAALLPSVVWLGAEQVSNIFSSLGTQISS